MLTHSRLLAYAQLMRLPNVFTAFADIALGAAATGSLVDRPGVFALLLAASGCLYLSGMVWNDVFDRNEDARTQAFRPIPSGRVRLKSAVLLGVLLTAIGIGFGGWASSTMNEAASRQPATIAAVIAGLVLMYDVWLKHTLLGPVGMGLCRFFNVVLGTTLVDGAVPADVLTGHLAGVVGVYIVGVTWFARTEEADSNRRQLAAAAGLMLLSLTAALALPVHFDAGATPWYFPYLLVGFGFYVGVPVVRAVRQPEPKLVQAAVKRSILGLVALDAVLATAFVGLPGLFILLLLPPALWLGKWVYST